MSGSVVCIFYKSNIYNSSNLASFSSRQLQRKFFPSKRLLPNNELSLKNVIVQRSLLPPSPLVFQLRFYLSYSLKKLS